MKENKEKDNDLVQKKIALIFLLLGLIVSLAIGLIGGVKAFLQFADQMTTPTSSSGIETTTPSFRDGNTLNFSNGKTYTCSGGEVCGWAYEMIDDVNYSLKYLNDQSINMFDSLIDNRYAFIVDGEKSEEDYYRDINIKVYDTTEGKVIGEYFSIKNYSKSLYNNSFIAQNTNGKWGVINLADGIITNVIEFKYDYIGVFAKDINEDLSSVDKLAVLESGQWSVINFNGEILQGPFVYKIIGYENNMVVVDKDGTVDAMLNGQGLYTFNNYKSVEFTGKNSIVFYNDTALVLVSSNTGQVEYRFNGDARKVSLIENNAEVSIVIDGKTQHTIK